MNPDVPGNNLVEDEGEKIAKGPYEAYGELRHYWSGMDKKSRLRLSAEVTGAEAELRQWIEENAREKFFDGAKGFVGEEIAAPDNQSYFEGIEFTPAEAAKFAGNLKKLKEMVSHELGSA